MYNNLYVYVFSSKTIKTVIIVWLKNPFQVLVSVVVVAVVMSIVIVKSEQGQSRCPTDVYCSSIVECFNLDSNNNNNSSSSRVIAVACAFCTESERPSQTTFNAN